MASIIENRSYASSGSRHLTGRLPERLSLRTGTVLAAGDSVLTLFAFGLFLNGLSNAVAAAVVAAAITVAAFWLCGLYRRSYALTARDEIYHVCAAVTLAAIPVALVISGVAQVPLLRVAAALAVTALGASAWHARYHLERRRGSAPAAGMQGVTLRAWRDRDSAWFRCARRCFDVTIAALALIVTFPIMLVAALAIRLESGAPVLFRQSRVGKDGEPFEIFKFRTMRTDAGSEWAKHGDERITRSGRILRRTSIDELPQLFNVLRGEMSIVGPRPEMLAFAQTFAKEIPNYDQRHIVTPGITGWAQTHLKRNLEPSDVPYVLPYDLFYVQHASIALDLALLYKTVIEVLFHRAV